MAIQEYTTSKGAKIYELPVEVFPGMWGHAFLVGVEEYRVLIDAGSGFGSSNEHLEAGLREAGNRLAGKSFEFRDLTHILITHGHIDHFGGLNYVCERTDARIGVHELDRRNITNYEERITIAARRLGEYLIEAGVSKEQAVSLLEMYRVTKALFHSIPVQFTYDAAGMKLGPFEMLHVPGHSAGHTAIRLHDIVFSGDHVLQEISPHQSPERLTLSTGLEHYLKSLEVFDAWAGDARMALGGHKKPVTNIHQRVEAIRKVHQERLDKVKSILCEANTIAGVSKALFGEVHGYNVLLALEEAGAHVEYLYQRGMLEIANLNQVTEGGEAIMYKSCEGGEGK